MCSSDLMRQLLVVKEQWGQVQFFALSWNCRTAVAKLNLTPLNKERAGHPARSLPGTVLRKDSGSGNRYVGSGEEKTVNPRSVQWSRLPAFRPRMMLILRIGRSGGHRCFADSNVGLRTRLAVCKRCARGSAPGTLSRRRLRTHETAFARSDRRCSRGAGSCTCIANFEPATSR